jgi:SAM-dependent methyltransferase
MAFQTLSQFIGIEIVFQEVKRVLAPGGVFLFAEETLRRKLTLRLFRCPYYRNMKPWERLLYDWGLLGYVVRDVIGANQEESFGIRQNHSVDLRDWHELVEKHFAAHEYEISIPERGWAETVVKRMAQRLDPCRSHWRGARLLGGSLACVARMAGGPAQLAWDPGRFESALRCPDCAAPLARAAEETLGCTCGAYRAPLDGGVYNLLASGDKAELYPGDREDIIDFSLPGHERHLMGDWYDLEGVFGNKYRWIGDKAEARLARVKPGPQRIRIRGFAVEENIPVELRARVNGVEVGRWTHDRYGVFVIEADVPDAAEYRLEFFASPSWRAPTDDRTFTVNLGMIRLVPR